MRCVTCTKARQKCLHFSAGATTSITKAEKKHNVVEVRGSEEEEEEGEEEDLSHRPSKALGSTRLCSYPLNWSRIGKLSQAEGCAVVSPLLHLLLRYLSHPSTLLSRPLLFTPSVCPLLHPVSPVDSTNPMILSTCDTWRMNCVNLRKAL